MKSKRTIVELVSLLLLSFGLAVTPYVASAAQKPANVRLEITRREPFEAGKSFGTIGPYEKIAGIAYLEIDPRDRRNAIIQDLDLAPRNQKELVEYSTDFYILKPVDMTKSNGIIFYDVVNRGNKVAMSFNIGAAGGNEPASAGDGFLQNRGYTIVWSGWQGDLLPGNNRLLLRVPVPRNRDGSSVTGVINSELMSVASSSKTLNLSSGLFTGLTHTSYEPLSLDNSTATLTMRRREADPRISVPNNQWAFADCTSTPFPGTPSTTKICLWDGFSPNFIYELTYKAKNPPVLGLGFAATRDLVSFFRHAAQDDAGTPNPLAGAIRAAIIEGLSQSGRYVRTFLDLGFNQDREGRVIFDGMIPVLSPGYLPLNIRFGQPGRGYGQHEDHLYPGYEAPFTWSAVLDPIEGRTAGLLENCQRTGNCPKIIQLVTSTEYWQGRMSLNTTDSSGQRDLDIPKNVRIYLFSGTQHVPATTPSAGICQQLSNPNPYGPHLRALLVALERWVIEGVEPPPSQIPTLKAGTLVRPDKASIGWPDIPGVKYNGLLNELTLLKFGPQFDPRYESGILTEPTIVVADRKYTVLVPKVDDDGNEIAGIRSTALQAPLATYTGWNLRPAGFAEDELCYLVGTYLPFARTKADRLAKGDPRLSLEERYETRDGYLTAVRSAAERLKAQRLLLPEDAESLIKAARNSDVLK